MYLNVKNEELYKQYGEFLINFEYVSHLMRFTILYLIFPDHSEKHTRQNEILMESLTADQIRNKFLALVTEDYAVDTVVYKLAKTISDIYERLIPLRNSFAHGTSFVETDNLPDNPRDALLILRHPKLRKTGLDLNFKAYQKDTLKLCVDLFAQLRNAVIFLTISIQNINQDKPDLTTYKYNSLLDSKKAALIKLEQKLIAVLKK